MPSNSASQTQAAQQGNQLQAEQYLSNMMHGNMSLWNQFFSQNPNPAQGWSVGGPSFSGQPSTIGGGQFGGAHGGGTLAGAMKGFSPSMTARPKDAK